MDMRPILNIILTSLLLGVCGSSRYRRVCYFTNWSQYRNGDNAFRASDITEPGLCTHYIFAFSKVLADNDTLDAYEWNDDISGGNYHQLTSLKQTHPDVKVLLAVGGWTHGSMPFVEVVSNDTRIDRFCDNVVKYLRDRNFDGLDLDWEYPAHRGSNETDRERFTLLVETMMKKFEEEAGTSGKSRLLLTAAVPAKRSVVELGYDVEKLSKSMDFINLMSYDFDVERLGLYYLAPLWTNPTEKPPNDTLNVHSAVELWARMGVPRDKIVLGIPFYGRQHVVQDGSQYMFGENIKENTTSVALYSTQICQHLQDGWTSDWDNASKVAIMYRGDHWANYDDFRSLDAKVQYIKENELGGFMIWELSLDDFRGKTCNRGKYPKLTRLYQGIEAARDDCPPGTWGKADKHGCYSCGRGMYQGGRAQSSCLSCPKGFSTDGSGTDAMYKCRKFCPAGEEYNHVTQTCDKCHLNYFRPGTEQEYCQRCTQGMVTTKTGSQSCVPNPDGAPTEEASSKQKTITFTSRFKVSSCENEQVLMAAIKNELFQVMKTLNSSWGLCVKGCKNVNPVSVRGCVETVADGEGLIEVETIIINLPEDLSRVQGEKTSIRPAESVVAEDLVDRAQFARLSVYGVQMDGVTSIKSRVICIQSGQIIVDGLCTSCPPGTYQDNVGDSCLSCPIGQYQSDPGQTNCTACEDSKTTLAEGSKTRQACVELCEKGRYMDHRSGVCLTCPVGTYQEVRGQTSCLPCPDSMTTREDGAESLVVCTVLCPPGKYMDDDVVSCRACSAGTYQSVSGQTGCIKCPDSMTTAEEGADSREKCIVPCVKGTYLDTQSKVCRPCVLGTYQNFPGQRLCTSCPISMTTRKEGATSTDDCVGVCEVESGYCSSTGLCHWSTVFRRVYCHCQEGYRGERCDIRISESPDYKKLIGGSVGGSLAVLLILLLVVGCCLYYRCNRRFRPSVYRGVELEGGKTRASFKDCQIKAYSEGGKFADDKSNTTDVDCEIEKKYMQSVSHS